MIKLRNLITTGIYCLILTLASAATANPAKPAANPSSDNPQEPSTTLPARTTAGLGSPAILRQMQLCGPPLTSPPEAIDRNLRDAPQTPWLLEAEEISANQLRGLYSLRGQACLQRLDQTLRTTNIDLNEAEGLAIVPGYFSYSEAGLHLWGSSGRFNLRGDTFSVNNTQFRFYPYYHGAARNLQSTGTDISQFEDIRYSTCPPGAEFWQLHAGEMEIDYAAGIGKVRHARLEIGGIPWLYAPYMQFPIDNKPQSGLLPPSFGNSATDGGHITLPVYLRFAPNYDLTLYPTYYSRRGTKIGGELRYLRRNLDGQLSVEHMSSDKVYAKQLLEEGEEDSASRRWSLDWSHQGSLPGGINYGWDIARVSDEYYLRDFSANLIDSGGTELESIAFAERSTSNHYWRTEAQHWQNLRPESRPEPYRHWPAVTYEHTPGPLPGGLEYRTEAQAIQFELPQEAKEADNPDRPTGQRYHINPRLSWPLQSTAFFVEPAVSLHHTRYDLVNHIPEGNAGGKMGGKIERTVPIASLDAGMFLERPFSLGQRNFLQTLEPRIFYLYAPHEQQEHLPIFDTGKPPNTVAQLFQENRFSGIDRIGDANQMTTAITSRFRDIDTGAEPFRASIGQIIYFEDRQVTLAEKPDPKELSRSRSDIFADAQVNLADNLNFRAEHRYDPHLDEPVATTFTTDLQYHPAPRTALNLSYRIRKEVTGREADDEPIFEMTQDYIEASGSLPIDVNWTVIGGWQYSRLERQNLEVAGGVEYRSCCWAIRGVGRRLRRGAAAELENTVMVELELTGLTRFSDDTESFIKDLVRGYEGARF